MFTYILWALYFFTLLDLSPACKREVHCHGAGNRCSRLLDEETAELAQLSNDTCQNGKSQIINVGKTDLLNTVPKIKICFDPVAEQTIWTRHFLGKTIATDCDENSLTGPWLKQFYKHIDPEVIYSNISSESGKGQLIPACDFDDAEQRELTFFYLNAAPQNKKFDQGNWKSLERSIRKKVNERVDDSDVVIITGTTGSQFVIQDKLDYPLYFFKVVICNLGNVEIYVGVNDVKEDHNVEDFCTVIPNCGWSEIDHGKVYCCEKNEKILNFLNLDEKDLTI